MFCGVGCWATVGWVEAGCISQVHCFGLIIGEKKLRQLLVRLAKLKLRTFQQEGILCSLGFRGGYWLLIIRA